MRTLDEVKAALDARIDEKQLEVREDNGQKFTYVPWEVTARELNRIFGYDGWQEQITGQHYDTERGIYIVSRRLVATAVETKGEGEDTYESHVAIVREGVGCAVAQPSRATGELTPRSHDTAIKAADSDSFSRAAKKLGDAFGLFLYDKSQQSSAAPTAMRGKPVVGTVTTPAKASGNGNTYQPSAAQLKFLHSLGYPDEVIASMSFKEWKGALDTKTRYEAAEVEEEAVEALPF